MQPRTNILTGITVIAAMTVSAATMAADVPKEGTFSGTYVGPLTFLKTYPIGKERSLMLWEDNSSTIGNGFLDHLTWHCLGTTSIKAGVGQFNGYCMVTDPTGDQIVADISSDGTYQGDAKVIPAKGTFTTGTGKYTGISGTLTNVLHTDYFRTAVAGTLENYGDFSASYKLP